MQRNTRDNRPDSSLDPDLVAIVVLEASKDEMRAAEERKPAHVRAVDLMAKDGSLTFGAALTRASQAMKATALARRAAGGR